MQKPSLDRPEYKERVCNLIANQLGELQKCENAGEFEKAKDYGKDCEYVFEEIYVETAKNDHESILELQLLEARIQFNIMHIFNSEGNHTEVYRRLKILNEKRDEALESLKVLALNLSNKPGNQDKLNELTSSKELTKTLRIIYELNIEDANFRRLFNTFLIFENFLAIQAQEVNYSIGQYRKALPYLEHVLNLAAITHDSRSAAYAYNNMADIHIKMGNSQKAIELAANAISFIEKQRVEIEKIEDRERRETEMTKYRTDKVQFVLTHIEAHSLTAQKEKTVDQAKMYELQYQIHIQELDELEELASDNIINYRKVLIKKAKTALLFHQLEELPSIARKIHEQLNTSDNETSFLINANRVLGEIMETLDKELIPQELRFESPKQLYRRAYRLARSSNSGFEAALSQIDLADTILTEDSHEALQLLISANDTLSQSRIDRAWIENRLLPLTKKAFRASYSEEELEIFLKNLGREKNIKIPKENTDTLELLDLLMPQIISMHRFDQICTTVYKLFTEAQVIQKGVDNIVEERMLSVIQQSIPDLARIKLYDPTKDEEGGKNELHENLAREYMESENPQQEHDCYDRGGAQETIIPVVYRDQILRIAVLETVLPINQELRYHFENTVFKLLGTVFKLCDIIEKWKNSENSNDNGVIDSIILTIKDFEKLFKYKDRITYAHIHRVSGLTSKICPQTSGLPHDIGKFALSSISLKKPGRLTEKEYKEIQRHPSISEEILNAIIPPQLMRHPRIQTLRGVDIYHHLKYFDAENLQNPTDGRGYPTTFTHLFGDKIPFPARVTAYFDALDALTGERPYNKPKSHSEAMDILDKDVGTHFCPTARNKIIRLYNSGELHGAIPADQKNVMAVFSVKQVHKFLWDRAFIDETTVNTPLDDTVHRAQSGNIQFTLNSIEKIFGKEVLKDFLRHVEAGKIKPTNLDELAENQQTS